MQSSVMSVEKCNQEMMSVETNSRKNLVLDGSKHEWDSEM